MLRRPPRWLPIAIVTATVLGAALVISACGAGVRMARRPPSTITTLPGLPPDALPVPSGSGREYRLGAISAPVARRAPVAGLRCLSAHPSSYGVHVELYAHRLVLPLPAGIGVAPPLARRGVYVVHGSCSYAVRTFEPTGVVVVDRGRAPTLATLFALWGQPLGDDVLASFRGQVVAFVGGRRWHRTVAAIALGRHAEIVLQVGGALPPHSVYRFPPGL